MIALKIECGCGQHYAFDVEPVNGRMPSAIACPVCGADGTGLANEILARQLPPPEPIHKIPPPAPVPSGTQLKIATEDHAPVTAVRVDPMRLGMVSREQAEHEARAKLSWGDTPETVAKFLMLQGFSVSEAKEIVTVLYKERLATVRANGIRKIVTGIGLMFVPVIALLLFLHIGVVPMKLMAIAVMIGLWGVWQLLNGIIALVAPRMESGDVADQ